MGFELLIVVALASFRIASLLVDEAGPFDMFGKLRHLVGVRYNAQSERIGESELAKAFNCVWCLSIWSGFVLAVLMFFFPDITFWLCMPFALSGAAIILYERTHG